MEHSAPGFFLLLPMGLCSLLSNDDQPATAFD